MNIASRWFLGLLLAGLVVLGGGAAQAHPHVWITATSELLYAPDGSITGVRHAWTFDDMFSVFATLPLLEFKQLGVGLAAAIALDATVVRGLALPAVLTLLGDRGLAPAPACDIRRPGWDHGVDVAAVGAIND